uniref:Centrosomal AT-AC splicing factor n=1 Tax=Leptobrachium leishanense TaxID=445787 RepID=A0A8C5PZF6_9ANUR
MAVYHCKICQRTVFSGRRKHVYEKGHRERLAALLKAFGVKVAAARKMIKVASVAKFDAQEHEKMFWCHCCEEEVRTHTSDGGITVLYGSFLEHMFSPAHRKAVNKFWWTQQADVKLKPQFMLSPEEYERYKSSVIKALENYEEKEDVYIKEVAAQIREVEQSRLEILQSVLEVCLQRSTEHLYHTIMKMRKVLSGATKSQFSTGTYPIWIRKSLVLVTCNPQYTMEYLLSRLLVNRCYTPLDDTRWTGD